MLEQTKRHFFVAAGFLSLLLGFIGIFLPVLPTAPFVILAAFCFSRGSERLHRWLLSQPHLGPMILEWDRYGVIRRRAKITATVLISLSWISTLIFLSALWMKALITFTLFCVVVFIWLRPSEPPR